MPRPTNRAERRTQIANALLEVMAERGYERSSVAEVARRAGLNHGLLHYHFKSKHEILLAALEELTTRHEARLEVVLGSAPDDPVEQVRIFLDFHLGLGAAADPTALACWVAIGGEALKQPDVQARYAASLEATTGRLLEIIENGIKSGQFRCPEPAAAASALVAVIQGYFVLAATSRELIPRGSAAESAMKMAEGLLGTDSVIEGHQREPRPCAVYAGTFDPFTKGHLSVVEAAARLFDRVIVLVAVNPDKDPVFTAEERLAAIESETKHLPNVSCASTEGYVVEYARDHGASHLVRGLRDATDATQETLLAQLNRQLAPEVRTLFIPADPEFAEVSSTRLKELVLGGADVSGLCSPDVADQLARRLVLNKEVAG